ncbi:MAG TPA: sensor histidine kinase, partial [Candidatus Avoscillospira stercoripullorum]|nr:sensor histidine kinase [Candidatus Avoscillospira stercoripullorum]
LELRAALEEALLSCYGALHQRGITPALSLPDRPVRRTLDPEALSRILHNILSNALKYSDGDLSVTMTEEGVITFRNAAQHLTPIAVGRLFDRYYTVESAQSSTGLGLSIAKALTERMGGRISAAYEDGSLEIRLAFP